MSIERFPAKAINGFQNYEQLTGSGNFTVPAGVYSLCVFQVGGGAGGGAGSGTASSGQAGGGGGASGEHTLCLHYPVTPGQSIPYACGAGGSGGSGAAGSAGGDTTFGNLISGGGDVGAQGDATSGTGGTQVITAYHDDPASGEGVWSGFVGAGGIGYDDGQAGGTSTADNWLFRNQTAAVGGSGSKGNGGGGGSSFWGTGGAGGSDGAAGANAAASSYGAGGGGGGHDDSSGYDGGDGTAGVIEVRW